MSTRMVVGVSTADNARYTVFYASLMALDLRGIDSVMTVVSSAVISENRNHITKVMLDQKADYVLYLDDDHILPSNVVQRLLAADKDVISAHYIRRQPPFNPVLMEHELPDRSHTWKLLDPKESGIVSVAAVGAGCLLIKRKVIEALEPPYWTLGQINPASWGDDLDFCSRVRKAGFEVHCDLDNPIGHLMIGSVWPARDEKLGWTANYMVDPTKGTAARWVMPLPGEM